MRLIHVADVHLGVTRFGVQTPTGNSRVADFGRTLDGLVEYVREFKPEVTLFAGDTFNTRHAGPDALAIFAKVVTDITRLGSRVVVLPGNHDGMSTIGDPRTHALLWARSLDLPMMDVITSPGWYRTDTASGPLHIFALPYPHKRSLDRILPGLSGEERMEAIGSRLEDAIATLGVGHDEFPHIFLGHLSVAGSRLGSEQAMKMGWDVVIRPEVLERFDYAALGHIHRAQQVGPRAYYAGSPDYIDFGEMTQTKGFYMVDLAVGKAPNVAYLPSNTRPLAEVSVEQEADGGFVLTAPGGLRRESIVRVRVHCTHERPSPTRLAELIRQFRKAAEPSYIKTEVDLDLPESRERATIDSGTDVGEALRRWLAANGQPEEPALTVGRELAASVAG